MGIEKLYPKRPTMASEIEHHSRWAEYYSSLYEKAYKAGRRNDSGMFFYHDRKHWHISFAVILMDMTQDEQDNYIEDLWEALQADALNYWREMTDEDNE